MDRFIRTNGIQLHYLEHPGDGPSTVLLPGLTANAHAFDGLVQAGLSPRFHTLALDLRGRGLSDAPEYGYTMADHAADVLGLLDAESKVRYKTAKILCISLTTKEQAHDE